MALGGSICCRDGSHSVRFCKSDKTLLLLQLADTGLEKLKEITVKHAPSMPSKRVTAGYGSDQKDTFHQLAEINSLFGAGVSVCRPCSACAHITCSTLPSAVHAVTASLCEVTCGTSSISPSVHLVEHIMSWGILQQPAAKCLPDQAGLCLTRTTC